MNRLAFPLSLLVLFACGCGGAAHSTDDDGTEGSTGGPATTDSTGLETSGSPECILWEPDQCPDGQKCMPYSELPDEIPDTIICCDEAANPAQVGDPCEITDYNGSCLDTCIDGTVCVQDDAELHTGICHAACEPGGMDCEQGETCKTFFEMVPGAANVPLCMPQCDPLAQDCADSEWRCIPDFQTPAGQSGFICVPPPPIPEVPPLGPCSLANQCQKGYICLFPDRLPSCDNATGCCSALCSNSGGTEQCTDDPSLVCVDWMGPDPPWGDVGVCALPG